MKILKTFLLISLITPWLSTHAFGYAFLEMYESIGDTTTLLEDNVSVYFNPCPLPYICGVIPPYAINSGYASAGDGMLRADSAAKNWDIKNVVATTTAFFQNSFTIRPGTSGLEPGDLVRLRYDLRLQGALYGSEEGGSWMQAYLRIPGLEVGGEGGEGEQIYFVNFSADAFLGPGGGGYYYQDGWRADTDLMRLGDDTYYETPFPGYLAAYFDTGIFEFLGLEFNSIVGRNSSVRALLTVWAGGGPRLLGGANSNFFSTFETSLTSLTPGVEISWEIPPTTAPVPEPSTLLLLGSGLIGLAGLRRKLKG